MNDTINAKIFLSKDKNCANAVLKLEEIYEEEKDDINAEKYYLQAFDLQPKVHANSLGVFYYKIDNYRLSLHYYKEGSSNDDVHAMYNLVELYGELNKPNIPKNVRIFWHPIMAITKPCMN